MSEFIKLADDTIEVYVAESVEDAMIVLQDPALLFPEVIYVDLNMPVQNGFEFIEAYESGFRATHPDARLYMLTSSLRSEDRQRALMYQSVNDFVSKNEIDTFLQKTLLKASA